MIRAYAKKPLRIARNGVLNLGRTGIPARLRMTSRSRSYGVLWDLKF